MEFRQLDQPGPDYKTPHSDAVWGVAYTPSDKIISISADGSMKQWQAPNIYALPPVGPTPHLLGLVSLSVSPDGHQALYNSVEGMTYLCNIDGVPQDDDIVGKFASFDRTHARPTDDPIEPSWSVSLHPNRKTYASTGSSGYLTVHSAAPGPEFGKRLSVMHTGRNKFCMHCAHSPDGTRASLASETGQVYVFDIESAQLQTTLTSHAMSVRSVAWSTDSSLLLSASEDKRVIVHDVRTPNGGTVAALSGHTSWVMDVDISHDMNLAVSASADKTIKVWDLRNRTTLCTARDAGEVWSVAFSPQPPPQGRYVFVSGGEDGEVRVWTS
ncbi:WD40 repeat-like protein [Fistulina hepatica ATCC 64428]|nr:WD40 repeat-like protein [Fistulina hepatica ATCC 64428]